MKVYNGDYTFTERKIFYYFTIYILRYPYNIQETQKYIDVLWLNNFENSSESTRVDYFQGEKTLERIKSQRMHQISVVENRRQQNCTILLSKLKLTNAELVK